ncbi:hypothetical protein J422_04900 [Methanocaldococcus villosus KIN24-T80]|uniref:PUA domain-containing protein n=2 Tax=Methanocaldococcus villosus TaxID=667126 RepID=N6VXT6_9EURY|nr:hypothetical protein J422_04900 [Methanocaldococcus villosus KIN24-T80]
MSVIHYILSENMKTYIGKIHLKWCYNCNLPILGKKCDICNTEALPVKLTPPGDARLGFRYDIDFINECLEREFGAKSIEDGIILLNKLPGNLEAYEVIVDGIVKYILYYNEEKETWKIKLKLHGAYDLIEKGANKRIVKIKNDLLNILKDKSTLLRPGIIEITNDIERGDDVIIVNEDERVVGVGLAMLSSNEIEKIERGKIIKVRFFNKNFQNRKLERYKLEEALNLMIEANNSVIYNYEKNAIGFIKNSYEKIKKPVIVAYSGGKDSLVTLILTLKALKKENVEVIFIDTGLEFPETLKNIEEVENFFNIEIKRLEAENFWEKIKEYGIPSRDYRWCSEVCKLNPLKEYLKDREVLSFVGIRKYESFSRAKKRLIYRNTYIKNQINALPIFHWTALHVWIYILKEGAPYNKLYEKGFDRVGCYICPAMELGEMDRVRKLYPELWEKWENVLKEYANKYKLPEDWIRKGLWRWKKFHPKDIW